MPRARSTFLTLALCLLSVSQPIDARRRQDPPPRILIDQPLRAVEYQLGRLTSEELSKVERKDDDVRYRPVYVALLTRKGLPRAFRDEALAALIKLDKTSATHVLLEALAKVPIDDAFTAEKLLALLLSQPAGALRQQRGLLTQTIDKASPPLVLRGAYGSLLVADGTPDEVWKLALARDGHLVELLDSIAHLPLASGNVSALGAQLFTPVAAIAAPGANDAGRDTATRVAAFMALAWTRRDAATFEILGREIVSGVTEDTRVAAARSWLLIPDSSWPEDDASLKGMESVARAIIDWVGKTAPDRRIEPGMLDVIQLGEKLAATLPAETARAVRRDLRALGVQVVRIEAVPEQMTFDLKWFVVEAGKPVQIVLFNPDAMPHNLVVGQPGSLKEVVTLAGGMPIPTDPSVKPYVPNTPLVLYATRLVQSGDTERLGFRAPSTPGEYLYVCTFPGHWLRMYGVMLVVPNLEAWEAKPTVPTDPMTGAPFTSKRDGAPGR